MLTTTTALQTVLVNEYAQSKGMFAELARIETLLAETYRNRVQYELLQNSDDAGSTAVAITIHDSGTVIWENNGRPFSLQDIEALCRSASSTKQRGDSIGYRGIGFKSLAAVARNISVTSSNVSFSFSKENAQELLQSRGHSVSLENIPLIRIPTKIQEVPPLQGASFCITPSSENTPVLGEINPLALLFLHNIRSVSIRQNNENHIFTISHTGNIAELTWNDHTTKFATLSTPVATLAIPLDDTALALSTRQGHLSCFLPLNDQLGLPLVLSGDVLTDPSRTNAITTDVSTRQVLESGAKILSDILATPSHPLFERTWELTTKSDDLRVLLSESQQSTSSVFITSLRTLMTSHELPFSHAPFTIDQSDIKTLFPQGAPTALYKHENEKTARSLRVVFGMKTLKASDIASHIPTLSRTTVDNAASYFSELMQAKGTTPTPEEKALLDARTPTPPKPMENPLSLPTTQTNVTLTNSTPHTQTLPEIFAKWRAAELTVCEWLNQRGWQLRDVSKQNLGYDLEGTDPEGKRVMLEIKRVERVNTPFSMTNNEMGAAQVVGHRAPSMARMPSPAW